MSNEAKKSAADLLNTRSSGWAFTVAYKEATRDAAEVERRAASAVCAFIKGIRAPKKATTLPLSEAATPGL